MACSVVFLLVTAAISQRCHASQAGVLLALNTPATCVEDAWAAYRDSKRDLNSATMRKVLRSPLKPRATWTHDRAAMASTVVLQAVAACDQHTNLTCSMVWFTLSTLNALRV